MKNTQAGFIPILIILAVIAVAAIGSFAALSYKQTITAQNGTLDIIDDATVATSTEARMGTTSVKQAVTTVSSSGIRGTVTLFESSGAGCPPDKQGCGELSMIGPGGSLTLSITPSANGTKILDRSKGVLVKTNNQGEFSLSVEPGLYYVSDGSEIDGRTYQDARIQGQWVEVKQNQAVNIEIKAIQPGV